MSSGERGSGSKAVRYAEDTLGVHMAHDQAVNSRHYLDQIFTDLAALKDTKRSLEDSIRDREMDLLAGEWADNPEFSATKMDNHMRVVKHGDPFLAECRQKHSKVSSEIEGLEYDKVIAEADIKIAVARLHELGGYLQYLAAVKEAETARKTENPETQE